MKAALFRFLGTADEIAPLIARLALGGVMFPHGAQKLFGWWGGKGPAATMEMFTAWGFAAPLVVLLIITESIGALLLVAGLAGRLWAGAIGVVMVVAIVKVHARWGFFMNWYGQPQGEGFEYHLLALALVLIVVVRGSGRWSADRAIAGGRAA